MYLLGYDIGSSSVKVSLLDAEKGQLVASALSPQKEMKMHAKRPGWAEQPSDLWWKHVKIATKKLLGRNRTKAKQINAIGISYQMHGLVLVDKKKNPLRKSIIWCDSRAVGIGNEAFQKIGKTKCLKSYLNSPGNFTASKLKWVMENEPAIYKKIFKIMLPGDYIAMKFTGNINTTKSGLSEGIMWNFAKDKLASKLLDYFKIDKSLIADIIPTFSIAGRIRKSVAEELGISPKAVVSYRAGDQPNNAFSLNVLNPGEIATTAGTSGVIYGISKSLKYEKKSRVNTFLHVNSTAKEPRYGILLCINGTGILYSWLKSIFSCLDKQPKINYDYMNKLAEKSPLGADNLQIIPFGNGAERVIENKNINCHIMDLQFNLHEMPHLIRAAQEGIVFSLKYGLDIMRTVGVNPKKIKAGSCNLFLSPLFCQAFAAVTGSVLELYNTDGSQGAARGAGVGAKVYKNISESFVGLKLIKRVKPDLSVSEEYQKAYNRWLKRLEMLLN